MPSTYTNNLGIELPADGEQDGVWGDVVNENMNILDRAINGSVTLSLSGTSSTLTTSDGILSNGQYKALILGGTPSGTHTITISPNDAQKIYFVYNLSGQSAVFTQGSGTNVTIANGDTGIIYSDGGGGAAGVVNLTDNFAMNSVKITGGTITGITDLAVADGGTGASDASGARTNLGLGTMATQAASSVSITGGSISGITDLAVADGGTGASDAAGARTNLGLGTMATQAASSVSITGGSISGITDLAIADGGTGASTAAQALINLGLTATAAELNYVSGVTSAIQTQFTAKANLASPALTGTPTAPTASVGTNTTQIATTAFVTAEIANDIGAAYAGLSALGVGTYIVAWNTTTTAVASGGTIAGSSLRYQSSLTAGQNPFETKTQSSSTFSTTGNTALTGTWRALTHGGGRITTGGGRSTSYEWPAAIWLRTA